MITNKTDIIVTNHVLQRVKERFPYKFQKYFSNKNMFKNLIIGQVSTGTVLHEWKSVPFYVNKISSEYGTGVEIIRKSGVYFICQYDKDRDILIVKTAVPFIMNYPNENSVLVQTKSGARWSLKK